MEAESKLEVDHLGARRASTPDQVLCEGVETFVHGRALSRKVWTWEYDLGCKGVHVSRVNQ